MHPAPERRAARSPRNARMRPRGRRCAAHASGAVGSVPCSVCQTPTFLNAHAALPKLRAAAASLALAALSLGSPVGLDGAANSAETSNSLTAVDARYGERHRAAKRAGASTAIALPGWFRRAAKGDGKAAERRRQIALEAVDIFESRYVDTASVPWGRIRRRVERASLGSDEELEALIRWMLAMTNDTYTRYLPARELDGVRDGIAGAMEGVGLVFSAETRGFRRARRVTVTHIVRGSPAHDAGIQQGDEIVAIDTQRVANMRIDDAARRMAGHGRRRKRRVLLTIVRPAGGHGSSRELSVVLQRRRFAVPTVTASFVRLPATGGFACYLRVRDFASRTAAHASRALRDAQRRPNTRLLVVDLRGNAGGLVDQAVAFARMLLPPGRTVVHFVGRNGATSIERTRRLPQAPPCPVIVLVDERTASASELVAAALSDNCRAVVVGTRTFGKGSVQAVVPLSDGAGVAITVAAYRTPSGHRIADGVGCRPHWIKGDLPDDAVQVVHALFGRAEARRFRWLNHRLHSCRPPLDVPPPPSPWWRFGVR